MKRAFAVIVLLPLVAAVATPGAAAGPAPASPAPVAVTPAVASTPTGELVTEQRPAAVTAAPRSEAARSSGSDERRRDAGDAETSNATLLPQLLSVGFLLLVLAMEFRHLALRRRRR